MRNPRSSAVSRALLLLSALLCATPGCSSSGPGAQDAGAPRDTQPSDSTIGGDSGHDAGSAPSDTGTAPDAGPACGGACDPTMARTCHTAQRCVIGASGEPECMAAFPDAGTSLAGDTCAAQADCSAGLGCFLDPSTMQGRCARLCCPGASTCDPAQRCAGDDVLVDGSRTSWARCLPPRACDLAHPSYVCAPREGCYIVDGDGHTECLIAGTGADGEVCSAPADCAAGLACVGLITRTCATICLLGTADPHGGCGDTRHCVAQAYSPAGTGICAPL